MPRSGAAAACARGGRVRHGALGALGERGGARFVSWRAGALSRAGLAAGLTSAARQAANTRADYSELSDTQLRSRPSGGRAYTEEDFDDVRFGKKNPLSEGSAGGLRGARPSRSGQPGAVTKKKKKGCWANCDSTPARPPARAPSARRPRAVRARGASAGEA